MSQFSSNECSVWGKLGAYFELRRNYLRTDRRGLRSGAGNQLPINERNISGFIRWLPTGECDLQDTYYDKCFVDYGENDLTFTQFRDVISTIERLLGGAKPDRSLLDIGCASGVFLDLARESGFEVRGIKVLPELTDYARQKFGLEIQSELISVAYPAGSFDALTLNDMMEYLLAATVQPMTV
jgi:2-polyprenyl-3-methyl-5-hydroxy-6-metoxy-1,4-benzoquinol methylase